MERLVANDPHLRQQLGSQRIHLRVDQMAIRARRLWCGNGTREGARKIAGDGGGGACSSDRGGRAGGAARECVLCVVGRPSVFTGGISVVPGMAAVFGAAAGGTRRGDRDGVGGDFRTELPPLARTDVDNAGAICDW